MRTPCLARLVLLTTLFVDGRLQSQTNGSAIVERRVWAPPPGTGIGAISPDGQRIAFTRGGGALLIRTIADGEPLPLWSAAGYRVAQPRFSPDGRSIAFLAGRMPKPGSGDSIVAEIHVIGADGAGNHVVTTMTGTSLMFTLGTWSPDARWLAVTIHREDGSEQLATVATSGGGTRVIKSFGTRTPQNITVSPDGQFIAYDFPPDGHSGRRDLFTISVDGRQQNQLTHTPTGEHVIAWPANRGSLVFGRRERDEESVWEMPMRGGKAAGRERQLHDNIWGFGGKAVVGDKLFYTVAQESADLLSVQMDPRASRADGAPSTLLHASGFLAYTLSHDRAFLAYAVSNDGAAGARPLYIRSLAAGEERELTIPVDALLDITWSPDGKSIDAAAMSHARVTPVRIDLKTGQTNPATIPGIESPERSPDGKHEFTRRVSGGTVDSLFVRDVGSTEERFVERGGLGKPQFAPDGRVVYPVALGDSSMVRLFDSDGTHGRTLMVTHQPEVVFAMTGVTPDGAAVLATRRNNAMRMEELWRVPLDGSPPQSTGLRDARGIYRPFIDRKTGRLYYFVYTGQPAELWVMEHLPAPRP